MTLTKSLEHQPVRGWDTPAIPSYASGKEVSTERQPPTSTALMRKSEQLLSNIEHIQGQDHPDLDALDEQLSRVQEQTHQLLEIELNDHDVAEAVEGFLPSSDAAMALELWLAVRLDEAQAEGVEVDDLMFAEAQLLAEAMASAQPELTADQLLIVARVMVAEINAQRAANQLRHLHKTVEA